MKQTNKKKPVRHIGRLAPVPAEVADYGLLVSDIVGLLQQARRTAARSVNAVLTAAYWQIGRRIVEHEQGGAERATYGEQLVNRLSKDLTGELGRGFSRRNLEQMRAFYLGWEITQTPSAQFEARTICQTLSGKSQVQSAGSTRRSGLKARLILPAPPSESEGQDATPALPTGRPTGIAQTLSAQFSQVEDLAAVFPLSWSQYARLMSVANPRARAFYESEAIRGGWSVRQLDRQIGTQFFERAVKSKEPGALLARGQVPRATDAATVEEQVRDPYLLEFLDLKDEYSETELEDALVRHLEWFLLELGAGFTFVARQKRIRIGDTWYRMDLLLYHRGLRCLVVVDLKTGTFTHADAGQMNLYLNYVKEHLAMPGESDPVGIILCTDKDDAVVKYATGGIRARVFASKYLTILPDEEALRREIVTTRRAFRMHMRGSGTPLD